MKNKRCIYLSFYVLISLCVAKNAFAQATYAGLGYSGVSMVSPLNGAFLNPALLSYMNNNHAYLLYNTGDFSLSGGSLRGDVDAYGIALIDTQTSALFKGAFTFTEQKWKFNSGAETKYRNYSLSIARLELKKWAFGLNFHRQEYSFSGVTENSHGADLGITYGISKDWGVSFVTNNIAVDEREHLPKVYHLGTHYIWEPFMRLNLDLSKRDRGTNKSQPEIAAGMAIPVGAMDLNMGYFHSEDLNTEYFTMGFAWKGPRLSLAYAYTDLLGSEDAKVHYIDIGVFF